MRLRHPTMIALAASLAVHGALAVAAVRWGQFVHVSSPGPVSEARIFAQPLPVVPPDEPFGVRGGMGEALSDFEASDALRAREATQDQPLLGMAAPGPLRLVEPTSAQLLASAERVPPLPASPPMQELVLALSEDAEEPAPLPAPVAVVEAIDPPADAAGNRGEAREQQSPTDPGAPSGRELDLFSREAVADLRAGRAVAREGREHRIRGLRPGLAAMVDAAFIPRPAIVQFSIRVDRDGTPIEVRTTRTSGSDALDETLRKAVFNSWFDPDPSGTGHDLGKPFLFTMRLV